MQSPTVYNGRVFRLSQDYPKTKPVIEPAVQRILAIDFRKDWRQYLEAVRAYAFEGNFERPARELDDYGNTFYLEDNKVRRWYHMPWMHYGPFGREGIHGLTKEAPIAVQQLAPQQIGANWQSYAIGFYNDLGGYMIGRVFADADNPNPGAIKAEGGFPIGTVVAKLLFTTANGQEVPYLKDGISWNAYVTKQYFPIGDPDSDPDPKKNTRIISPVLFIQMDIMVRDSRADATGGWVFGNFVYNAKLHQPGRSKWLNLAPVGLMWGNDPAVRTYPGELQANSGGNPRPVKTVINPALKETIINPGPELPPMHLGWGGRLNGPLDNPMSSCQSCHSAAEFRQLSNPMVFAAKKKNVDGTDSATTLTPADPEWMRWFRNIPVGTAFDEGEPGVVTMDGSLQMAAALQHFIEARVARDGGFYRIQYGETFKPAHSVAGSRGYAK